MLFTPQVNEPKMAAIQEVESTPEVQREKLSVFIAKAAHELKVSSPELWLQFMKALSALQDHEIMGLVNQTPHPQSTFYQQGRARLAYQLFAKLEQCSEVWKEHRDNEALKEQARARTDRTGPTVI